jgi:dynein heavy chain
MNTVIDDSKKLCLSSSAVINFTERMAMLFEVEDLAVASPATVSRCGMVYMEPNKDTRYPFDSWVLIQHPGIQNTLQDTLGPVFDNGLVRTLGFMREKMKEPMRTTDSNIIQSSFRIFHSLVQAFYSPDAVDPIKDDLLANIGKFAVQLFWFGIVWSVGCTTDTDGRALFDQFVREQMRPGGLQFPADGLVYDYKFNTSTGQWQNWMDGLPPYHIPVGCNFTDIVVPTIDNVRNTYLLKVLLRTGYHFFCTARPALRSRLRSRGA